MPNQALFVVVALGLALPSLTLGLRLRRSQQWRKWIRAELRHEGLNYIANTEVPRFPRDCGSIWEAFSTDMRTYEVRAAAFDGSERTETYTAISQRFTGRLIEADRDVS